MYVTRRIKNKDSSHSRSLSVSRRRPEGESEIARVSVVPQTLYFRLPLHTT
jgi:hypothetical protein